jgi:ubiquinone/menaquinone biosynthesis C-methylase UbiE
LILVATLNDFDSEDKTIEEVEVLMKSTQIKNSKSSNEYLMESEEETIRLEVKTDPDALRKQAIWCGVKPGMRILDVACGPGKTTSLLHDMIQPGGSIVGIDFSEQRINYAKDHYGKKDSIDFHVRDFRQPLIDLGEFDLIWVRFVLEYYRKEALEIVGNLKKVVKPGGSLCLLDLDHNCLSHFELSEEMEKILPKIMKYMDEKYNFDTYIGRKLYSFLYDNGFEYIKAEIIAHNLFYGNILEKDIYNLSKKIEIAAQKANAILQEYEGGFSKFKQDINDFFNNKRRFSYSPLIICKGIKPISN